MDESLLQVSIILNMDNQPSIGQSKSVNVFSSLDKSSPLPKINLLSHPLPTRKQSLLVLKLNHRVGRESQSTVLESNLLHLFPEHDLNVLLRYDLG